MSITYNEIQNLSEIERDHLVLEIFRKFLEDKGNNWVEKIVVPDDIFGVWQLLFTKEEQMLSALYHNTLTIHSVDNDVFTPSLKSLIDAFKYIQDSDYSWILSDVFHKNPYIYSLAVNMFMQIWLYGKPVYFG